ncbi:DUF4398 domain-containing protein [Pseudomonas chlororaphis]|uniref:DUF4398 domain-containing protein n=1 Tax=Pseudomonas chlororaphis TaxID=587753 RepID=UPI0004CF5F6E|nr:DUF4398 domain-containing protein [Pseudomonas chlororaphis]AZD30801.1 hypothetical protein C4K23_4060 [Pseudomonas chlororaphis]QFS56151.1 DUF4398 domain-containing protein [Pseudomonas chlororaphis subsp. aurantiaca]
MSTKHVSRRAIFWASLLTGTVLISACASAPAPDEQVSLARNALSRAVSAGATQYAPVQMKTAQDKTVLMDRALGEKNFGKAKGLAEQIEADSALAERMARTAKLQKELKDAQTGIQVLKQEMLQAPDSGLNPAAPIF